MDTFLATLGLSLALSALVLILLVRLSILDVPNERSLHSAPVPRGGGVAPAVACVAAAGVLAELGTLSPLLPAVSAALALLGLTEDLRGLPAFARLAFQALIVGGALVIFPSGMGSAGASVLALLWVVAFTNAFNFMDGIDGISAVQVLVAGGVWAWTGNLFDNESVAMAGLIAAAGALGFLPFNLPRARMFLGDTGSLFFGGWLAVTAAWGIAHGVPPEALLAPLALYLGDTGSTLLRRIRRGEPWLQPHRQHAYQRLVQLGASHKGVDLLVFGVMTGCSVLGLVAASAPAGGRLAADLGICLLVGWYLTTPRLVARAATTS